MNPNTNELRMLDIEDKSELLKEMNNGFIPLPENLQDEAEKELGICERKIVTDNSKLLSWAEKQKSISKENKSWEKDKKNDYLKSN